MMKRTVDYLAEGLYNAGCRYAFGMPGGEVLTILDSLKKHGITFVLNKHENNGGHMAEGIYQRTGAIGVLVATIGPGVTNIVNAVANAHQERVPLIVVTGCVDPGEEANYTHQILNHQDVFKPVVKASFKLNEAAADTIVHKAIAIALDGRPGPVHIDVPIGVADAKVAPGLLGKPATPSLTVPAPSTDLERAKTFLAKAKKPLLIAGLDVLNQQGESAIRKFVDTYQVPIVTTYKGKGIVPEDHPLSLGGAGLSPLADTIIIALVKEADLIIGAGYDPIEMRGGWKQIWNSDETPMIDFTAVPNTHYMHSQTLSFVGNVATGLKALSDGVEPGNTWENGAPQATKKKLAETFAADDTWGPSLIVDRTQKALPKNTIASSDTGAHRILLSHMWMCHEPKTLLQSTALCTMAIGMPIAAGAKMAEPNRTVVAFTGDAGLLMCLGDLATVKELGLPIIVVVFVDTSIALIEKKQRERGLDNTGVDFDSVDFAALARAFGGNGFTATNEAELLDALARAQLSNDFSVVACKIPRKSYEGKF